MVPVRYSEHEYPDMPELSILFISADRQSGDSVEAILNSGDVAGTVVNRVDALFDGLRCLQERAFDVIVTDLYLPDGQGLATFRHLQQHAPSPPVIVLCRNSDRETA